LSAIAKKERKGFMNALVNRTTTPTQGPKRIVERIVQMKLSRQHWGPKKVIDRLRTLEPGRCWPADSTAGEILKRAGPGQTETSPPPSCCSGPTSVG